MMEESEKRRERIKAMMEAAQAVVSDEPGVSGAPSYGLSNPFVGIENAPIPFEQTSRRFNYYTDPASAFGGRKGASSAHPRAPPGNFIAPTRPPYEGMPPPPRYQNPPFHYPPPRMFQAPGTHPRNTFYGNPTGAMNVMAARPVNPQPPLRGTGGPFSYSSPPNFTPGGNFVRPSIGRPDSPYTMYGRGMDQRCNTASSDGFGRGMVQQGSNIQSTGSGPSFRRGAGSKGPVSAKDRRDSYYNKGMIEDPWKFLNPTLWKGPTHQPPDEPGSWLPGSISAKKAKVSESSSVTFSQGSLAQYLAEAFHDPSVDEKQDA